jgi:tungstate transport system substrate-binding protein
MYNDFVLIGPKADPAGIKGSRDIAAALVRSRRRRRPSSRAATVRHPSGRTRPLAGAGVDLAATRGTWYREIGQGMGAALNTAGGMNAYVLSDRATWLSFRNRGDLDILVEGDRRLFNQYGIMLVNPQRHPHVKQATARPSSTGSSGRRARRPSPTTRSTASSCSSPTPPITGA